MLIVLTTVAVVAMTTFTSTHSAVVAAVAMTTIGPRFEQAGVCVTAGIGECTLAARATVTLLAALQLQVATPLQKRRLQTNAR